jgi:hypothetical protein
MTVIDLHAVLSAFLISAGTLGRREAELRKRFRHLVWEDVLMELQIMWEKEQVQRFTMDKKHIWRATDKLNV